MDLENLEFFIKYYLIKAMKNPLCRYKDVLGKPGEGVHSYRICNIAVVDLIMTVIGAWIISKIIDKSFSLSFIFLFTLGIILHRVFCVKTTLDILLFGDC